MATQAAALSKRARSKYLEAAHAQEQLLFWMYTTRQRKRSWLTDPLALWRIYWRWLGILLLSLNSSFLLRAAWHHHRCEADPLCVQPLCHARSRSPREQQDQGERCAPALHAARSGSAVQLFSVTELLLGLRLAASPDLNSHGYRRGYRAALLLLDAVLSLDALDALLLTLGGLDGGKAAAAAHAGGRGAAALPADRPAVLGGAASLRPQAAKWKWAWWEEIERAHLRPWWEGLERAHFRPAAEQAGRWWAEQEQRWAETIVAQQRWLIDVQRRVRDTRLVRTVVGYQRFLELPKPPRPVEYFLDTWALPAIWGEGLEKLHYQMNALPAIGDAILAATMLQAFAAGFLRSLKALILLASTAKALRVRRRLRHDRAAQLVAAAWRRHRRRHRARRDVARLRWQQAVAHVNSAVLSSGLSPRRHFSVRPAAMSPSPWVLL